MNLRFQKKPLILAVCFFAIFALFPVMAADFHSARTAALGGAGHAGPFMTDSVYLNPSFLSYQKNYAISGNWVRSTEPGPIRKEIINAALTDGSEGLIQAGMAYTRRKDVEMYHLAVAVPLSSEISIGIAGKGFHRRTEGMTHSKFDGMASVTWIATPMIQVAGIVDNVRQNPAGREFGNLRSYILGTKLNIDKLLLLYGDPSYTPDVATGEKKFGLQAGAELPLMQDLFLRSGFYRDTPIPTQAQRGRGWGMGFGWIGPKMSIDYAYSKVQKPKYEQTHTAGVSIFF